jgi:two-component system chemotaxis response regulator CheY
MSLNVLIVDDSAVMRSMISRTLTLTGLPLGEIYQSSDGLAGLKTARECWIDLALVDLNMPVMGGEEMIEALRSDGLTTSLPIIVVSSDASDARRRRLHALGAQFVLKPFTPEQLRDVVLTSLNLTDVGFTYSGAPSGDGSDF